MTTLNEWIAVRTPTVPQVFASWMTPVEGESSASMDALAAEAEISLARALEPADRPRAGAFDLLAADGFLSWAAEAALESEDPDAALSRLIQRFG